MRDGTCPRCGADSVYDRSRGIGDRISVRTGRIGFPVDPDCFVCTGCGYFELYLGDEETLRKIERDERWARVEPRRPR